MLSGNDGSIWDQGSKPMVNLSIYCYRPSMYYYLLSGILLSPIQYIVIPHSVYCYPPFSILLFSTILLYNYRYLQGASVAQWQHVGLLVNWSSDRSCTRGMVHKKNSSHQPRLSPAQYGLTVQNCGLKHQSFHVIFSILLLSRVLLLSLVYCVLHQYSVIYGQYIVILDNIVIVSQLSSINILLFTIKILLFSAILLFSTICYHP